jgi:hypothetical protein
MGYTISNIYVITTVAVIGGALFGFDIASMSAMYGSSPESHVNGRSLTDPTVSVPSNTNVSSIRLV